MAVGKASLTKARVYSEIIRGERSGPAPINHNVRMERALKSGLKGRLYFFIGFFVSFVDDGAS